KSTPITNIRTNTGKTMAISTIAAPRRLRSRPRNLMSETPQADGDDRGAAGDTAARKRHVSTQEMHRKLANGIPRWIFLLFGGHCSDLLRRTVARNAFSGRIGLTKLFHGIS